MDLLLIFLAVSCLMQTLGCKNEAAVFPVGCFLVLYLSKLGKVVCVSLFSVVSSSVVDCLERLISKMTCYMLSRM